MLFMLSLGLAAGESFREMRRDLPFVIVELNNRAAMIPVNKCRRVKREERARIRVLTK